MQTSLQCSGTDLHPHTQPQLLSSLLLLLFLHRRAGHTFCYACLSQHLLRAKNCPACSQYLATDLIYPNFLLSKVGMAAVLQTQHWAGRQ